MKKNTLPTAADLKFNRLDYSTEYPPIACCICGNNIGATGALMSDIQLFPGENGVMSLVVCSDACGAALKGPKAGAVTSFIQKEAGRLKRLFPKRHKGV